MIDKQAILKRCDLQALAEHDTQLRRVASTEGGELAGPCPFCGGRDRFRVQPSRQPWGLWLCRQCTPKWSNAIDYLVKRDGLDFKAACAALAGGDLPTTRERRPAPEIPAYDAPADDWQAQALQAVQACADNLIKPVGAAGLAYLRGRGLKDDTLRFFFLGFSPGAKFGGLYVPRGVMIPCIVAGEVWYLKICLLPGDPVKCEKCKKQAKARQPCPHCGAVNKYRGVKGNRTAAIYGANDLPGADLALFVEGEINALTAWQELRDVLPVVTLGGATNRPDLATWGAYLVGLRYILSLYDPDQAGRAGAAFLKDLSGRVRDCALPEGVKDINDFYLTGGDLWAWLRGELDRLGVLQA